MNAEDLKTLAEMKVALIKFRLSKAQERWLIAHLEAEVREANKLRALASTYLEDCEREQSRAEAAEARAEQYAQEREQFREKALEWARLWRKEKTRAEAAEARCAAPEDQVGRLRHLAHLTVQLLDDDMPKPGMSEKELVKSWCMLLAAAAPEPPAKEE